MKYEAHVSASGGVELAIGRAKALGANALGVLPKISGSGARHL